MKILPPLETALLPSAPTAPLPRGGDFGRLLQGLAENVHHLQGRADQQVSQSLTGQVELHEAMLALEKASLSLKLLLQVRNKMVQAYEELSRMPL